VRIIFGRGTCRIVQKNEWSLNCIRGGYTPPLSGNNSDLVWIILGCVLLGLFLFGGFM
jgi:hypothetical protein